MSDNTDIEELEGDNISHKIKNAVSLIRKAAIHRQYGLRKRYTHKINEIRNEEKNSEIATELATYKDKDNVINSVELQSNLNYDEGIASFTSRDTINEGLFLKANKKLRTEPYVECAENAENQINFENHNLENIDSDADERSLNSSFLFFTEPAQEQSNQVSILMGIFVAVGGFLYGYDTGLINSIVDMNYVKENFTNDGFFTAKQLSIIVSFLSLGTFGGALFAPFLADVVGRKPPVIMSAAFIFLVGNTLQVAATGITLLTVGRVISGVAVGIISVVVPLYQGEASKKSLRGAIISTYQWAITWGLLVSSAVSQGTYRRNNASSYRIPIALQYIWSCTLALGMIFLPESPRFFVLQDKLDKAASSLSFLRGVPVQDSGLLEELVEIKATYDYELSFGTATFWDCFKSNKSRPKQTLRMFTGIAINAFQQFSGINFIFYYGVNFFSRSGIPNSYRISFITYAVNVAFNVPGMFLVDYSGRRTLLIYGGIVMAVSNFVIAGVGTAVDTIVADKVMVAFICLFIASFACTWGSTVWVISAELYPLGVRSKCMSICAASNWLVNFICAFITPYIVDIDGHTSFVGPKIFFLWGGLNTIGLLIAYFTVYETKGLTLEEINELFEVCPSPRMSKEYNANMRNKRIKAEEERRRNYEIQMNRSSGFISNQVGNIEEPNGLDGVNFNNPISEYTSTYTDDMTKMGSSTVSKTRFQTHLATTSTSTNTEYDHTKSSYFDLGNGLGLNTHNHGPPSLPSDSENSDDDDDIENRYEIDNNGYNTSTNTTFYTSEDEGSEHARVDNFIVQLVNNTGTPTSPHP
ncbi:hypothetical protein TPHA_0A03110 [Tetrapisispora phaffii CBS 4417]|uniref:Major facilitator superfamily (MFS) profile domain-containing protein n=1 Tax=Tetrapisispora phaffii (strain ATCC 24235 / CBS 4417 / NBRC 1672 / NRRL Y-8282 / UCD 70-5) TaxID=1071381 RepID=G8BNB1_TETPH|nr:hypothetical protein TPHA_0A03110 [Tetrapisispora phaffii CBS 4417]CCE61389.1 hypothetical protein TPHA_0A03110 [Tetrapisispora phaffii CBS 4417]